MGLRVCPECGAWVSEHAPRCIFCGYPLLVGSPAPPPPAPPTPPEEPTVEPPQPPEPTSPPSADPIPPDETEDDNGSGGNATPPDTPPSDNTGGELPSGLYSSNLNLGVAAWMISVLIIFFIGWCLAHAGGNSSSDYDWGEVADSAATDSAVADSSYYDGWATDTTDVPADY